jgi:hypothetical protein
MEIRNGATVSNANGYLGVRAGSAGEMLVTGADSLWENAGDLAVGYEPKAEKRRKGRKAR